MESEAEMNWNPILDELERDRDAHNAEVLKLNKAIDVIRDLAGGSSRPVQRTEPRPRPAAIAVPRKPTAPTGAKRGRKAKSAALSCDKHPDNKIDFSPKGNCRVCTREYQRDRHARIKAGTWSDDDGERETAPPSEPDAATPPGQEGRSEPAAAAPAPQDQPEREFVYSKPLRCGKCGLNTRFKRLADADPQRDYWVCMASRCTHKIAHVMVKTDRDFKPEAA